ncbi:hypothetical protein CLAFUW4_08251 [Fulvia fulva]|nr:uncharacterized protein CLAFUR5_20255 [Fulvia fulva]KAK4629303.1 hypothetical protein CLAFUR4_08256 [Fulvia fulva]KAK4630158.1 hypothetical protein CLAFUR0_08251 [Fulvia fulva]WMI38830.1 hypothetical protein CLAFUR5_20255 [Fulvia fulva]WPV12746.1 hypothetical protein CLAFUW4_08251 [Fulvia fulva]WPV27729.1 hypothetical protein CLAFUW7_08251 [Fulvia fulva]
MLENGTSTDYIFFFPDASRLGPRRTSKDAPPALVLAV